MAKIDIGAHPCFNADARGAHSRVHLPVAPRCNVRCNFCDHKHDCVNESRPGVSARILTPEQAADYLDAVMAKLGNVSVAGIAGPGDPFANPAETMETLRLVRSRHPDIILCVATNGLAAAPYVDELAALGVSHATVTINAVDPALAAKIYAWARSERKVLRGAPMGELIVAEQAKTIQALKAKGVAAKVNTIVIPGVNDRHVPEVAARAAALGADIMNCIPMYPVPGTPFASLGEPDPLKVAEARRAASALLPQMAHCGRCRADAAGLLGEPNGEAIASILSRAAAGGPSYDPERPYVAAASMEGAFVNLHLGEADTFRVFAPAAGGGYRLAEERKAPPPGGGDARWEALAAVLADCRAVLASASGPRPKAILSRAGLHVVEMEGLIEDGLASVFSGRPLPARLRPSFAGRGSGCGGHGRGCA